MGSLESQIRRKPLNTHTRMHIINSKSVSEAAYKPALQALERGSGPVFGVQHCARGISVKPAAIHLRASKLAP